MELLSQHLQLTASFPCMQRCQPPLLHSASPSLQIAHPTLLVQCYLDLLMRLPASPLEQLALPFYMAASFASAAAYDTSHHQRPSTVASSLVFEMLTAPPMPLARGPPAVALKARPPPHVTGCPPVMQSFFRHVALSLASSPSLATPLAWPQHLLIAHEATLVDSATSSPLQSALL
ncbi:hypothetical protein GOP47_0009135, partial [Adiantum capillus-veneris]